MRLPSESVFRKTKHFKTKRVINRSEVLFYLQKMVLALPNNSYLIKMGWTGLPGTNAPGLNDINAFLLEVDPSGKIIN